MDKNKDTVQVDLTKCMLVSTNTLVASCFAGMACERRRRCVTAPASALPLTRTTRLLARPDLARATRELAMPHSPCINQMVLTSVTRSQVVPLA